MNGSLLTVVLAVVNGVLTVTPLTIGSPAPKLAPMKFVRGDPVKELAKGTVYVIEFSGVECVPCHKVIPLLVNLQKAHPKVVFVSVYGNDEKAVREFLADKGKGAEYRVAVDPAGVVSNAWSAAALQAGIPHAFVVDAAGTVAWIGHAANLADPLRHIVAGTFDPRAYAMRLRVEQGVALRERRRLAREAAGSAEYKRVNGLVIAGKLAGALAATDRALTQYAGCPNATGLLRRMKMYLLANLPGRKEEAVALATDLAIDARLSGRSIDVANTASSLLNAAEGATLVDRDQRLVDLAIVLLTGPDPDDLRGTPPGEAQQRRASSLGALGWAYHLQGDHPKAVVALQEALAITEKLKPDPGANEKEFAVEQKQAADFFRERLAELRGSAGRGTK